MKNVFLWYAKEDQEYFRSIHHHLKVFKARGLVDDIYLGAIDEFSKTNEEFKKQLQNTGYVLALLSMNFIEHYYTQIEEVKFVFELYDKKPNSIRIIPIVLEHCQWWNSRFGEIQVIPSKPIEEFDSRGNVYRDVVYSLERVLKR